MRINENAELIAVLAIGSAFWLTGESWVTEPVSAMRQRSARINRNAGLIAFLAIEPVF
ncbi:hypothetical protein [Pediococcus acidilactici]|nr:hypothetical protein [Pediococcus acidilactici]EHJ20435.1 hypothetical protein KIW_08270 [Pediococcus acidilactici MA18/5M]MBM6603389.1 hypothetical protein [Pediococcus acidilactici]MBM6642638.1 hypothetical protein [Pediococcus acidilactici]MCB5730912.1 hypothetical protein [Pediococcus acidilactici]MCB5763863.1 hypothetical protein [Pediococcus acidilactici]